MRLAHTTSRPAPADPTPVTTIAHPMRRIPPLDVALDQRILGPGWSSLADAVAAAVELTRPSNTPMVTLVRDAATGMLHAWAPLVDVAPAPDRTNWRPWYLEAASQQAGPAHIDWASARTDLVAFVDGRVVIVRPGAEQLQAALARDALPRR